WFTCVRIERERPHAGFALVREEEIRRARMEDEVTRRLARRRGIRVALQRPRARTERIDVEVVVPVVARNRPTLGAIEDHLMCRSARTRLGRRTPGGDGGLGSRIARTAE